MLSFILFNLFSIIVYAQYKAVITNLNTNKTDELKVNDSFYYGIKNDKTVYQGKLENINENTLTITNKTIKPADLSWIGTKSFHQHKKMDKVSKSILYAGLFGITVGAYEYGSKMDKNAGINVGVAGIVLAFSSSLYLLIHGHPKYQLEGKHLLEIVKAEVTK